VIDRVLCSTIVCVFIAGASACARSEPPQSAETPPVASAEEASIDAEVGEEVVEVGEEVVEGDEEMAEGDEEAVRKRLADELEESIEAERRELRAQCERGDQKACVEAVCFELIQAPTERKYRDCATVQEFTTTDLWVQMSALRVSYDNSQSISVVCMHPEVVEIAGNSHNIFTKFELRTHGWHGSGVHEKDRFFINPVRGPNYATWEEAADSLCSQARSSE
jgi:hypothetical protein